MAQGLTSLDQSYGKDILINTGYELSAHHCVLDWLYAGASAKRSTITALDAFFKGLDADGITYGASGKIKRLNLFCGSSLSDCLRPQLVTLGGSTDSNTGFAEGDYSNYGLQGASGKKLSTGVSINSFSNCSMGVYARTMPSNGGEVRGSIGAQNKMQVIEAVFGDVKQVQSANGTYYNLSNSSVGLLCGTVNGQSSTMGMHLNGSVIGSFVSCSTYTWDSSVIVVFDVGNYSSSSGSYAGYFISQALTDSEHANLYTRMQSFQSALNRSV